MSLLPPKIRHLISSNFQSVQNYLTSYHAGVKEHSVVFKIQGLMSNWNEIPRDERSKDLDSIDHQLQKLMTNSENKCRNSAQAL